MHPYSPSFFFPPALCIYPPHVAPSQIPFSPCLLLCLPQSIASRLPSLIPDYFASMLHVCTYERMYAYMFACCMYASMFPRSQIERIQFTLHNTHTHKHTRTQLVPTLCGRYGNSYDRRTTVLHLKMQFKIEPGVWRDHLRGRHLSLVRILW